MLVYPDILTELDLLERERSVKKDILLDRNKREKYLKAAARHERLDRLIDRYEGQMRVNY